MGDALTEPKYGYVDRMQRDNRQEPSERQLNSNGRSRQFVTALSRGLDVLACFGPEDRSLGNQEIARRTGLPKPTVSRLTYTLTEMRYLVFHKEFARYSLSPRVLELGYSALASSGIADIARPVMRELSENDDVAISLGVTSKQGVRIIELVRRPEAVVASLEVGKTLPVYETAIGRAWLAHLSADAREEVLDEIADPATARAAKTIAGRAVTEYEKFGYVKSIGEWRPEINAIATVIETSSEPLLINMGAMASILTPKRIASKFGPALVEGARTIQSRMRNLIA